MSKQITIDTGQGQSVMNLIQAMELEKLNMITGETENGEMMLASLIDEVEAKIKIVIMQDNDWNHITYYSEHGECLEDFYKKDDF